MDTARFDIWHTPIGAPTRRVTTHLTDGDNTASLIGRVASIVAATVDSTLCDVAHELLTQHHHGQPLARSVLRHRRQHDRIGLRRCSYQIGDDGALHTPRCGAHVAHLVGLLDLTCDRPDLLPIVTDALERTDGPRSARPDHLHDPWLLLGVGRHADDHQIRAAFRAAARAAHPDSGGAGGDLSALIAARNHALGHTEPASVT